MLAGRVKPPSARIGLGIDNAGCEEVHVRLEPGADVDLTLLFEVGNLGTVEKAAIKQQSISRTQVRAGAKQRPGYRQVMGLERTPSDPGDDRPAIQQRAQGR